jgi:uncharacterized iron-regulated membrane protein
MRRSRRTVWRRTHLLGGIVIELAVLAIALVLATVFGLLDRRR